MRNNSVKLFEFGPVIQEDMSFKRFLIWSSGSFLCGGVEQFMQYGKRGHHGEHSCEVI